MAFLHIFKIIAQFVCFAIICIGSDRFISASKPIIMKRLTANSTIILCFMDSLSHGVIAAYAWLLSINFEFTPGNIANSIKCAMIACSVDVDHFLAAGSWRLKVGLSDALYMP